MTIVPEGTRWNNRSSQIPDIVRAGFYTDFGHTPINVSWFKDDGHYLVTKSVGQAELIAAWDPLWLAQCLPIEMLTTSCQRRSRHSAWQILIQAIHLPQEFWHLASVISNKGYGGAPRLLVQQIITIASAIVTCQSLIMVFLYLASKAPR